MKKFFRGFRRLFDPIDLTSGSVLRDLLLFSVSVILSGLINTLYSMTDTIVVGQNLESSAIVGINDAASLDFIFLQFAIGLASGMAVVVAKHVGAKDPTKARQSLLCQLLLGTGISLLITVVGILTIPFQLSCLKIYDSANDAAMRAIYDAAKTYLAIIYAGLLSLFLNNVVTCTLRARGDAFATFLFLFAGSLLNIALDVLFVVAFHWGVAGTAWATLITQTMAALASFFYCFKRYPEFRFRKGDLSFPKGFVGEHLKDGLPLAFQFSILAIGLIVMTRSIISFDVDAESGTILAEEPAELGYSAANKLAYLFNIALSSLGTVMVSYAGQNYGAGRFDRIKTGMKDMMLLTLGVWLFCMGIGFLLKIDGAYMRIFLADEVITPQVLKYGDAYLYVILPTQIFLGVLYVFRNTLQGLEKPLWPFLAGVGELLARVLWCLFVPPLVNGGPIDSSASLLSYACTCAADPAAWLMACLFMVPPFFVIMRRKIGEKSKEEK